jgi:hypothetical protein
LRFRVSAVRFQLRKSFPKLKIEKDNVRFPPLL